MTSEELVEIGAKLGYEVTEGEITHYWASHLELKAASPVSSVGVRIDDVSGSQPTRFTTHHCYDASASDARMLSALLIRASEVVDGMNEAGAEELEKARIEEAEEEARRELAHQEHLAQMAAIKEELQWFIGNRFRMKRKDMKATVFGTINTVQERCVQSTSERGKEMYLYFSEIEWFQIKYEDDPKYTTVIDRRENQARALRT